MRFTSQNGDVVVGLGQGVGWNAVDQSDSAERSLAAMVTSLFVAVRRRRLTNSSS